MDFISYRSTDDDTGRRIDRVVRRFLPDVPLSGIYRFLRKGLIRINGHKAGPDMKLPGNAVVEIAATIVSDQKTTREHSPESDTPDIIFRSEDLLFVNKPRGVPVHGIGGLDRMIPPSDAELASLSFRTGPLHRLDKGTSGIITVSRTLSGARWFTKALSDHALGKYYLGLVRGSVSGRTEWLDTDQHGKDMKTSVVPVHAQGRLQGHEVSLVLFRIHTGRKHQIRKQAQSRGFPLLGDFRYGGGTCTDGYFLHAWILMFPSDRPSDLPEKVTAPLPDHFRAALTDAFGDIVLAKLEALTVY